MRYHRSSSLLPQRDGNDFSFSLFPFAPGCTGCSAYDLCIAHAALSSLKLQAEEQRTTPTSQRDSSLQWESLLCSISSASSAGEPVLRCICQPEQTLNTPDSLTEITASYNFTVMSVIYVCVYIYIFCSPVVVKIVPMQLRSGISV